MERRLKTSGRVDLPDHEHQRMREDGFELKWHYPKSNRELQAIAETMKAQLAEEEIDFEEIGEDQINYLYVRPNSEDQTLILKTKITLAELLKSA